MGGLTFDTHGRYWMPWDRQKWILHRETAVLLAGRISADAGLGTSYLLHCAAGIIPSALFQSNYSPGKLYSCTTDAEIETKGSLNPVNFGSDHQ